ncbi:MAG: hypothetical protein WBA16_07845 [Nonlabens sp.]
MDVLWVILAAIAAAAIALFQYGYLLSSKKDKRNPWFALIRFLTVLVIFILLINPRFEHTTYTTEKPSLVIAVDNSQSMEFLETESNLRQDLELIFDNQALNEQFEVFKYAFGDQLEPYDSISNSRSYSNQAAALNSIEELYSKSNTAVVLLTDGIQNKGRSYTYQQLSENLTVYPIIYGDTTRYDDVSISQLNVNKYSFLNNEFPVEVFVNYSGTSRIASEVTLYNSGRRISSKTINLSDQNRSERVEFMVKSSKLGLQKYTVQVAQLENERNTVNNTRNFLIEVIDQQTNVLLIASAPHPDLGALRKAVESNEQRKVSIKYYQDAGISYDQYDVVIFYGINSAFAKAYQLSTAANLNYWIITGSNPDLKYLNQVQTEFVIETNRQTDEVQSIVNDLYSNFNLDEIDFQDYPPLQSPFGDVSGTGNTQVLLSKSINGIQTTKPLWFTYEESSRRAAVTLGNGLWRWRAQNYLNNRDFKEFDQLVGSQIQYLSNNKKRDRLTTNYERSYFQNQEISIQAAYLDKNYEFDSKAVLDINLKSAGGELLTRPMILSGNTYTVSLDGLPAGLYDFTVAVKGSSLKERGSFEVLEFNLEQQISTANFKDFKSVTRDGEVYFAGATEELINNLLESKRFLPIERATIEMSSLIDFKYLLMLLLFLLGLEWFLRKYNGLI